MPETIGILIAGDDETACWLLRLVLQEDPRLAVVGYAPTGREIASLLLDLSPHMLLLDLDAPGEDTLSSIKTVKPLELRPAFVGLASEASLDHELASEMDFLLPKGGPLEQLPAILFEMGSREDHPAHSLGEQNDQPTGQYEQLISLYVGDLQRSQRDLEEKLKLIEFWMQRDMGGTPEEVGSGGSSYLLSVDGFFNAQHQVTVSGIEGELHPHSWRVSVKLRQQSLGEDHLLLGFADAKKILRGEISWFEGKVLNHLPQFSEIPPTTENMAALLFKNLRVTLRGKNVALESVRVWETPTNSVAYSES